ncbi:hypothetical protein BO71DRAFT_432269 [Aspergillus ellipticus CBS 707.79]|uniref:Major facilitator superfamily (MFS) profile domain-containing protein n=1 Tax=Aspergillus ellipticus CBS 707.79 TaxID=1448320 RepID=A0A319D3J9_9EURO|nr:hypothetical protein BO71DRAFT_432269 [Aspergillus ellipticus CBS 707.79]
MALISNISLSWLTDCYRDIVGDALVAMAFVRTGLATVIVFALTPWINTIGLENMFICSACISLALMLLIIPMIYWGKGRAAQNGGLVSPTSSVAARESTVMGPC